MISKILLQSLRHLKVLIRSVRERVKNPTQKRIRASSNVQSKIRTLE